jgi:hypothetical protein
MIVVSIKNTRQDLTYRCLLPDSYSAIAGVSVVAFLENPSDRYLAKSLNLEAMLTDWRGSGWLVIDSNWLWR